MQAKRWESLCVLAFSLPIGMAAQSLRISVYAPAGTVNSIYRRPTTGPRLPA